MSENENETPDFDEALAFEADHLEPDEPEAEAVVEPAAKTGKGVKYRVVLTNPYGRPGDVVTLNSRDRRVKHFVSQGVIVKV